MKVFKFSHVFCLFTTDYSFWLLIKVLIKTNFKYKVLFVCSCSLRFITEKDHGFTITIHTVQEVEFRYSFQSIYCFISRVVLTALLFKWVEETKSFPTLFADWNRTIIKEVTDLQRLVIFRLLTAIVIVKSNMEMMKIGQKLGSTWPCGFHVDTMITMLTPCSF